MEQDIRRLTPALYDFYVARARVERARAIAEFGGQLAGWVRKAVARLARPSRRIATRHIARSPTTR
jgi:hypothetical protein